VRRTAVRRWQAEPRSRAVFRPDRQRGLGLVGAVERQTLDRDVLEFASPDNRARLQSVVESSDGTLSKVVCGHLHPKGRLRVLGDPLGVELDVLEPIVSVEYVYGSDAVRSRNGRIVVEDLTYEH